ncbi:MAG: hypothetical protein ACJ76S_08805, partial [Solirubrobacteraceae bacterium]
MVTVVIEDRVLRAVNSERRAAGLFPTGLDAVACRGCRAHAGYLARNAPAVAAGELDRHDEDPSRPGYTKAGRAVARRAALADR